MDIFIQLILGITHIYGTEHFFKEICSEGLTDIQNNSYQTHSDTLISLDPLISKRKLNCNTDSKLTSKEYIIGVLLYTDSDTDLAEYVKKYFYELHKLSGDWCKIYVLEKPSFKWIQKQKSSLIEKSHLTLQTVSRKINKTEAYDIADKLEIEIDNIPCLILFGKDISQTLIFRIEKVFLNDLTNYFRGLFSKIRKIIANNSKENSSQTPFEIISENFDHITDYLEKHTQIISSQTQYFFEGQTIIARKINYDASVTVKGDVSNSDLGGKNMANNNDASIKIGGSVSNSGVEGGEIRMNNATTPTENKVNIEISNDVTNSAKVIGGKIYVSSDLRAEIQQILEELAQTSMKSNEARATNFIKEEINANPNLKQRLLSALEGGGIEALKTIFNHPVVSISIETIKGFLKT